MIHNDIPDRIASQSIVPIENIRLATPESHITDHDVVRIYKNGLSSDANSVSGGCLTRDRQIGRDNRETFLEMNNPRNVENNDSRPGGFASLAQRAWPTVI